MADRLTNRCPLAADALRAACVAVLASGFFVGVRAQTPLSDPTRPPPGILSASAESDGQAGNTLQSVLIPKTGKPVAIIGGQAYRLGERVGESRLIRLTEKEAVLEGPGGVERLQLTPGIEKTRLTDKKLNNAPVAKPAVRGSQP